LEQERQSTLCSIERRSRSTNWNRPSISTTAIGSVCVLHFAEVVQANVLVVSPLSKQHPINMTGAKTRIRQQNLPLQRLSAIDQQDKWRLAPCHLDLEQQRRRHAHVAAGRAVLLCIGANFAPLAGIEKARKLRSPTRITGAEYKYAADSKVLTHLQGRELRARVVFLKPPEPPAPQLVADTPFCNFLDIILTN
jgi:hypothetical protein